MSEPNKLDPTPGLPDDTLISDVEFPARVRKVLTAVGLKTVGEAVGKAFDREKAYDWLNSAIDDGRAEHGMSDCVFARNCLIIHTII